MHRLRFLLIVCPLAAACLMQLASCERYVLPGIVLTPDTLRFQVAPATQESVVEANVKCTLELSSDEGHPDWVSCTGLDFKGCGIGLLQVTVTENKAKHSRKAAVTITSESLRKQLVIIQNPSTE